MVNRPFGPVVGYATPQPLPSPSPWLFQISVTPAQGWVRGWPVAQPGSIIMWLSGPVSTFLIRNVSNSQDNPFDSEYIISSMNIAIVIIVSWNYFISHYQKHYSRFAPFLMFVVMCCRSCVGHGWYDQLSVTNWVRDALINVIEWLWLAFDVSKPDVPQVRHRFKSPRRWNYVFLAVICQWPIEGLWENTDVFLLTAWWQYLPHNVLAVAQVNHFTMILLPHNMRMRQVK